MLERTVLAKPITFETAKDVLYYTVLYYLTLRTILFPGNIFGHSLIRGFKHYPKITELSNIELGCDLDG